MEIIRAAPGDRLNIGRKGEHLARQVQFDLTTWAETYGEGRAELFYQRPGDLHAYPIAARRQGNLLLWDITKVDTAQAGKNGRAEIRYYVGDVLVILEISYILVEQTLDLTEKIPAMPKADWFEQVLEQVRRVEAPVTSPPIINDETGTWMIYDRETEQYENTGYPATGRDGIDGMDGLNGFDGKDGKDGVTPHIGANGNWFVGDTDTGISARGPQGPQGPRGPRGYDGPEGPPGERGPRGYDGEDGRNGRDGVGIRTIEYTPSDLDGGENLFRIEMTNDDFYELSIKNGSRGSDGAAGIQGPAGVDGKDGYTPVKGVDYYTEAEKAALVEEIMRQMGQIDVAFVDTIEECTDPSKLYVLPDGYIYAYKTITTESGIEPVTEQITEGFLDNTRLSTSSGEPKTQTNYVTTPLIDVSQLVNWKIRLTGMKWTNSDDGATISDGYAYSLWNNGALHITSYLDYKGMGVNEGTFKSTNYKINIISRTEVEIAPYDPAAPLAYTHIRFSGQGTADTAIVEIIHEVTTEGGSETKWVNTGLAFVPADNEGRIITLEADNAALKTRVKALEDAAVHDSSIPGYVTAEAEEVADKVLAVRTADSFVMGLASDLHTTGTDTSSVGVHHAGQGMDIIHALTQLDLVALLGDYELYQFSYGEGDTDGEDAWESLKFARKAFSNVAKGVPFLMLQGNHDELPADTTEEARQKYYAYIGANNTGTVTDADNRFRNYGYRDFEDRKIRVVYLNTADVSDEGVTVSNYVSAEQLDWLNTVALDLSDSGWGIIVLTHHPLNWDGMSGLLSALSAYKNKGSGAELIAHFHGHLHNFRAETLSGVLSITIPNACHGRNNEYGTYDGYSDAIHEAFGDKDSNGEQRRYIKTAGTAEDTAFNVIVVDRENRKIHAFNYGAGIDREISY